MPDNDYQTYMRQRQAMIDAIRAQAAQVQDTDQPSESDRAHLFTGAAALLLPAAQALITGALCGAAAWFYAWLLKSPAAWRVGVGVGLGVIVVCWLALLLRWLGLTKPLERLTGIDINQDGYIGDPPPDPEIVRIEFKSDDGRKLQFCDLPTSKEKAADFARGVLAGQPMSEARWSGAGALFSQNEFKAVRDELLARGWARWVNPEYPKLGIELTNHGRAVMRGLAGELAAPSPTQESA